MIERAVHQRRGQRLNAPLGPLILQAIPPGESVSRRKLISRLWGLRGYAPTRNAVRDACRRLAARGELVLRDVRTVRDGRVVRRLDIYRPPLLSFFDQDVKP